MALRTHLATRLQLSNERRQKPGFEKISITSELFSVFSIAGTYTMKLSRPAVEQPDSLGAVKQEEVPKNGNVKYVELVASYGAPRTQDRGSVVFVR